MEDLIEGMVRMMNQDGEVGPVNIGNPNEFTILELAQAVIRLIPGTTSKIVKLPLPADDPKQRRPDITKAKQVLDGWEPKIQLEEGLTRAIEYFKHLDLRRYKKPTPQTAFDNTEKLTASSKKREAEQGKGKKKSKS